MKKTLLKQADIWGAGKNDILITDGIISKIDSVIEEDDAFVVNMNGKIILPGFFNAHVHLYGVNGPLSDDNIKAFVQGGCTTVRDMGMTNEGSFTTYTKWLSQKRSPEFPDIITSGKFICSKNSYGAVHPSGAQIGYVINPTPDAAQSAVDDMINCGADQVKTGLDYGMDINNPLDYLPEDVFKAICNQAKVRGVHSCAHITKRDNFVKAAMWGLTESGHTPTNNLTDEDILIVKESGMAFNTTASIFDQVSKMTGEDIMGAVISNINKLYKAGIPMSVGTDYMHEQAPEETAGIPIHELKLLIKAGLSVNDVIKACTIDTANIIGVGEKKGSIEVGKDADIIATDLSIDSSFKAFEPGHIVFVMHNGEIVKNK